MKHIYKFTFLLLIPFFSIAQSNYKPGYVVTLKGDTIHGFVDYKEWDKTPGYIDFKISATNNKADRYSAKNSNAFAIAGVEYHQRFIVPVSQNPIELSLLTSSATINYITDTVFLKVIAKGKYLTLYSYRDDIKPRFYIAEAGENQPQELIYHAYFNADESNGVQYVNRYRIQLAALNEKYDTKKGGLKERIMQSAYMESELVKIVEAINGPASKQEYKSKNLAGTRWFAGIGANYSTINFHGSPGVIFYSADLSKSSIFPHVAGGIDFYGNKDIKRVLLRAEFSFTGGHYEFNDISKTIGATNTIRLKFNQYSSSITPQIIFNLYNREQLKFFVGAGVSGNFSYYGHHQLVTQYNSFPENVNDNIPEFKTFWVAIPVKAGIVLNKKMEINLSYTPYTEITDYVAYSISAASYQAGINYLFGK